MLGPMNFKPVLKFIGLSLVTPVMTSLTKVTIHGSVLGRVSFLWQRTLFKNAVYI